MRTLRLFLSVLLAVMVLGMSAMNAAANGNTGVGGTGGSTGGGTGGSTGGLGNSPGGGARLGWGPCPSGSGLTMIMWNAGPGGANPLGSANPPGAVLLPFIWDPVANPKGNVYAWPNTPWGQGVMPPNNKDQNGQAYYPWWGCYPNFVKSVAKPPVFSSFQAFAPAQIQAGSITLTQPSQCATMTAQSSRPCHLLVFDTVGATANTVSCVVAATGLTPMVPPPAQPYPATNTGVASYPTPPTPGCPESVTVVGTDVTGTWAFKYTLQWTQAVVPSTTCRGVLFDWGVPADGANNTTCTTAGAVATHVYQHVAPAGAYTPGSGAHITARAEWTPECSGVVTNLTTGVVALNDPVPGSYACVQPGPQPQIDNGPTLPIFQIESVSN